MSITLTMFKHTQILSQRKLKRLETSPIVINRRRIIIMPNKMGLLFLTVILTMLFGSINYDNSLGYALSFLLTGIGVSSILHTHSNLAYLTIEAGNHNPVHAGHTTLFKIYLGTNKESKFNIKVENQYGSDIADVHQHNKSQIILRHPSEFRGQLALGRFKVSSDYPFGIINAWTWIELDFNAIVYPKIESQPTKVEMSSTNKASFANIDLNRNDDFMGFRNYQYGDSPKHLYWKYYSANELLLTKQFAGGGEDDVWLNWDTVAALPLNQAISRLTRWVIECDQNHKKFGLKLESHLIKPNIGNVHRHACLNLLALFKNKS